jgi:uncharacterized protein (TIGR02996 family)
MPKYRIHPEELAFLAAIHAEPRDNLPRLVYADWLEEHEQADRATFIRDSIPAKPDYLNYWGTRLGPKGFNGLPEQQRDWIAQPLPPRMRFREFFGGLPLFWIAHPYSDLDAIFDQIEWDECLELELLTVRPDEYHTALRHDVMMQVHFVRMGYVDEYDILALSETCCSFRPITIVATIIHHTAVEPAQELLPHISLQQEILNARPNHRLNRIQSSLFNRFNRH